VEHDPDIIRAADWLIDIGPQAGKNGGHVLFQGTYESILQTNTLTGQLLRNGKTNGFERKAPLGFIPIRNARVNNLKNVSVDIPTGVFTCITGVAGSGKSSLVHEVFVKQNAGVVVVDQSPVGKTPRSTPISFIGVFDQIRKEIAAACNADAALFSFNSKGACPSATGWVTLASR
jgi:excinuclease UvrABC ATPase subunit